MKLNHRIFDARLASKGHPRCKDAIFFAGEVSVATRLLSRENPVSNNKGSFYEGIKADEEIIKSLGKLKVIKAVPAIVKYLNKSKITISWTAACVLGEIGDGSAIKPLFEMLGKGDDKQLKYYIEMALARLGDMRMIEPLIEHMKDRIQRRWYYDENISCLEKLTGKNFGSDYRDWKKWRKEELGRNSKKKDGN